MMTIAIETGHISRQTTKRRWGSPIGSDVFRTPHQIEYIELLKEANLCSRLKETDPFFKSVIAYHLETKAGSHNIFLN